MGIFELVISLLLVGAGLALFANRVGVPYPALLALAGAVLALIPGTPQVMLDPGLALALFVAPVLLDAAFDASPRDLKDNFRSVTSLAILAVGITIVAVAFVARWLVPDMSWPVAITLGAIVAPPDASAAVTVLRRLQPPHRLVVILEGESLFNDATALLVYRTAVTAVMTGQFSGWTLAPTFLLSCGGALVVGYVLAKLYMWVMLRVHDVQVSVVMQFIGTFGVWLLADYLHLSAIITVIVYAMTVARHAPARINARHRLASYAVWEVAVFVLNVLAFVLIGLQLRMILTHTHDSQWQTYLKCALYVCSTVILVRLLWVMAYNRFVWWRLRRFGAGKKQARTLPSIGGGLVISWCGMRGIVTLAAALALPDGGSNTGFPYRDLIILCAFCVVLTTLVLQGMTLGPLLRWVGLKDDGQVERELRVARVETAKAALRALDNEDSAPVIERLRHDYQTRMRMNEALLESRAGGKNSSGSEAASAADRDSAESDPWQQVSSVSEIQRRAVDAQRQALMDLRARGIIGDDAFHAAEEEIDLLELRADERIQNGELAA